MDTSTTRQTVTLALVCGLLCVTACNRSKSQDEQPAARAATTAPAAAPTTAPAPGPAPGSTPAAAAPATQPGAKAATPEEEEPATTAGFKPPKVYIEPQPGGFESYIAAGFVRKKTPVIVTTNRAEAAYILTAAVTQERESGAGKVARCAFADCVGIEGSQTATVQLTDQTGKVVWAYNVQKNGATSFQSSAEAIAKHLKEFLEPKPPKKPKKN
jgi:hypothetical protein